MIKIEVITDLLSCKIYKWDDQEMYDVSFNQWYLTPFKFDWVNFWKESYKPEDLTELMESMEGKAKDDPEYISELKKLEVVLEKITVVYKEKPDTETVDLVLYVNELINGANK